ncbi:hypothetical protein RHGRI_033006 [Rhododendron griersonianum]|uniref:DNA helicase Pif1-like 2B domain-containing protein n=1 Tax=Rhododendron griersonianum TaxID=479676 RepID=A0AAV6HV15_9ERIC|nr:hypothetical protein RHGRI_033006 [Rhododendron griersonianum]
MSEDDGMDRSITNRYPNEYLNSLDPTGLPPFKLELKVGSPIILLRNIAPKDGLCNDTRMMVVRCSSRIIEVKILTGEQFGKLAFIPRISLSPSSSDFPFHMTRRQFLVRLAYAMTINKSQGQSVKFVGVDLRTPVFSHGQLYVALSRCMSFDRITVLLPEEETDSTTNIVYPEVLLGNDIGNDSGRKDIHGSWSDSSEPILRREDHISSPAQISVRLSYNKFYAAFKRDQMAAAATARDSSRNVLWAKSKVGVVYSASSSFLEDAQMAVTRGLQEYWSNVV